MSVGASESSGGLTSYATGGSTMDTSSLMEPRVLSWIFRQSFVSGRFLRTSSMLARVGLAPIFSRYRQVYSLCSTLCSASSSTVSRDGSSGIMMSGLMFSADEADDDDAADGESRPADLAAPRLIVPPQPEAHSGR